MPTTLDGVNQFVDVADPVRPRQGGERRRRRDLRASRWRRTACATPGLREEVDGRLHGIMKAIHRDCRETAERFRTPGNYVNGANIAQASSRSRTRCWIRGWSGHFTPLPPAASARSMPCTATS